MLGRQQMRPAEILRKLGTKRKCIYNQKEAVEIPGTYKEERGPRECKAHKTY